MPLSKEEHSELLKKLGENGATRSPELQTEEMPEEYRFCLEQTERWEERIECEAAGVPVTCYISAAKDRRPGCPVHINFHGGGFVFPHDEKDTMYSARVACGIRGIVVDVDYVTTVTHPFPAAFEQSYEAAKWTFEQCGLWNADPKKVSIGGHSAGGCLAAAVSLRAAQAKDMKGSFCLQILDYAALDNYAPVLGPEDSRSRVFSMLYCNGMPAVLKTPYVSPAFASDRMLLNQPPTVILMAERCPFKEVSRNFGIRLAQMGNEVKMRCFTKSRHGFTIRLADEWRQSQAYIIRCINEYSGQEET